MTKQELIEQYKKTIENNKPYTELDISNNLNRAFNFRLCCRNVVIRA